MTRRVAMVALAMVASAVVWWVTNGFRREHAAHDRPIEPVVPRSRVEPLEVELVDGPTSSPTTGPGRLLVRSPDGAPIPDAWAYNAPARSRTVSIGPEERICAQANGLIEVPASGWSGDRLAVTAPRRTTAFVALPKPGCLIEVILVGAPALSVRCSDRRGAPVHGVTLHASQAPIREEDTRAAGALPSGSSRWCVVSATTDSSGIANLTGLPAGTWHLAADAPAFVLMDGLDKPSVQVTDDGRELRLVMARYFVALARISDPEGAVVASTVEVHSRDVLPTMFNAFAVRVEERLRAAHNADLCRVVVYSNDERHPEHGPDRAAASLRLATGSSHIEPLALQDPTMPVMPEEILTSMTASTEPTGGVRWNLRDAAGSVFDVPFALMKVDGSAPQGVSLRSNKEHRVTPGRYRVVDVPAARLWLRAFPRDAVVVKDGLVAMDALIPVPARLLMIRVQPQSRAYAVFGEGDVVAGKWRSRFDLVGDPVQMILPDSGAEIAIRPRPRGTPAVRFEVMPLHFDSPGEVELLVGE